MKYLTTLIIIIFTVTATQTALGASAQYPNEPIGYIPFASHNFSTIPPSSSVLIPGGEMGSWKTESSLSNLAVASDAAAVQSPTSVLSTKYPNGFVDGHAPVYVSGWDVAGWGTSGQKRAFYFSQWIKINGSDYQNQPTGTKTGFMSYAQPNNVAHNQGFFLIKGTGSITPANAFNVLFHQQGATPDRDLVQNLNGQKLMTVGTWHHWEAIFVLNDPSQDNQQMNNANPPQPIWYSNGTFDMWIDGVKIMHYTDVAWTSSSNTLGFKEWVWNPTWGGSNGHVRTRDDFILIDHVYMSGLPLTGGGPSPVCGNGVIESGEQCDNGASNGVCPATCSTSCTTNNCGGGDTTPPVATITAPINNQVLPSGTTTTPVTVTTNEPATCRRSATDIPYSSMPSGNTLTGSGTTSHSGTLSTFVDGGTYTRYIRCIDVASNAMTSSASVTFSISSASQPKTGDLNGDGIVNIIDVQLVVNKLGQNGVTTGEDINADSRVDIFDLVQLARNWG